MHMNKSLRILLFLAQNPSFSCKVKGTNSMGVVALLPSATGLVGSDVPFKIPSTLSCIRIFGLNGVVNNASQKMKESNQNTSYIVR